MSLPSTRQYLTQGQWPEDRLLLGFRGGEGLCWSSAHLVQCEPDEPSWTWTQIWAQACMPDYSLNWTARFSVIQEWQRCQWCSSLTRRWPSRSRDLSASSLSWNIDRPARYHWSSDTMPDSPLKNLCSKQRSFGSDRA